MIHFICRRSLRTEDDLEFIYKKLINLSLFKQIHPSIIQRLCFISYFEIIEPNVVGMLILMLIKYKIQNKLLLIIYLITKSIIYLNDDDVYLNESKLRTSI